eukprot:GHVU01148592.1.p2 GENE.GHVU01148592.1~~GHVU01148592.1.p2  ORF type:complete len:125 (-),score=2.40 GHVU01148592.1:1355-1729(-)
MRHDPMISHIRDGINQKFRRFTYLSPCVTRVLGFVLSLSAEIADVTLMLSGLKVMADRHIASEHLGKCEAESEGSAAFRPTVGTCESPKGRIWIRSFGIHIDDRCLHAHVCIRLQAGDSLTAAT